MNDNLDEAQRLVNIAVEDHGTYTYVSTHVLVEAQTHALIDIARSLRGIRAYIGGS